MSAELSMKLKDLNAIFYDRIEPVLVGAVRA